MTKAFKDKISNIAPEELPELIMPHIELCANKRAVVEGCRGILSYSNELISLNCKNMTVAFSGEDLSLCELCEGKVTVKGKISDINLLS